MECETDLSYGLVGPHPSMRWPPSLLKEIAQTETFLKLHLVLWHCTSSEFQSALLYHPLKTSGGEYCVIIWISQAPCKKYSGVLLTRGSGTMKVWQDIRTKAFKLCTNCFPEMLHEQIHCPLRKHIACPRLFGM